MTSVEVNIVKAEQSVGDSGFQVTLILIWLLFLDDGTKRSRLHHWHFDSVVLQ
jgi:hypothetical protein